jgi:hypothetical protein
MVARIDSCHRGAVESRRACPIWQPLPATLSMTSITVPRETLRPCYRCSCGPPGRRLTARVSKTTQRRRDMVLAR